MPIEEARKLLDVAEYGVLSMASLDGVPHGIPLSFFFTDDTVYFHCALEGKKIDLLSNNPRVSFCVIGRTQVLSEKFATLYESVIVTGPVEELFAEEKHQALVYLVQKYAPGHLNEGLEYIKKLIEKVKVFRIVAGSITGKARR